MAVSCGAESIPRKENVSANGKKFDVKKEKDGKKYYIQVKSGLNTMNVGMVESLNEMIEKIEEKDSKNVGLLGMTFGNKKAISTQIMDNLINADEKIIIGNDFWDFISEKYNMSEELLNIVSKAAYNYQIKHKEKKISDLIDIKKEELLVQWENTYGGINKESLKKAEDVNL